MNQSKRVTIDTFRTELKERTADSIYTNKFLYDELLKQAQWLIRREVVAGRIYRNNSIFQTLKCFDVIETSTIEECCPIKTNCKIYRTKHKLPEVWIDNDGPIIKYITSVDGSTEFYYTNAKTWQSKRRDPYQKMTKRMYVFFADGYLWFPEHNPHKININAFFFDDVILARDMCNCCENKDECIPFLSTKFCLPDWLLAECMSKAAAFLLPEKRIADDESINKNPDKDQ